MSTRKNNPPKPVTTTKNTSTKHQRNDMRFVPAGDRFGLGGKVIGHSNAGPRYRVGISLPDCRHHIHICGPTGTGKTSLIKNMVLDDVENGRGTAVFDPAKGDLITDLLDILPEDCGSRLVIIDPAEKQAPPSINLLDPAVHGGSPHDVAAHVTSVMSKVWARWWGDRMTEFCYHGLLTLAHLPGSTLAQLPRLLSDTDWRAGRVRAVTRRLGAWEATSLTDFWDGFNTLPAGSRYTLVAPLLSRLRLVLAHPLVSGLFGVPATTFRFSDILDGGVLLARLPKGILGEDGTRLVGSLLLSGLWQATTARARVPEQRRLDSAIYLDECHNFLHLPIGVDDALAEARGLRTSFVLAHQYLGQLSRDMAEAIDANARNKVYFALAPKDAIDQAHHVEPHLDAGDLMRLGGFEVVLRPVAGGRTVRPVTIDTIPPPEAEPGRAELLRAAARAVTGLPREQRQAMLAEVVIGSAHPDDPDSGEGETGSVLPAPMVGHNTFPPTGQHTAGGGGGCSPIGSPEGSHPDEHTGEQPGRNGPKPQLAPEDT